MSGFSFQIERFIVKQLACEQAPEAIVEDIQGQFLRDIDADQVRAYDPEADGSALNPDLRDLYQRTRRDFLGEEPEEDVDRTFVEVATTDVFEDESIHCVEENGVEIALIASGGEYSALANRCTHQDGPLCEGEVSDDTIECPWHGAEFDVHTGEPATPPAVEGVNTFEVRVQGDTIEVKL